MVELKINRSIKEFIDNNKEKLFESLNVHEGYSSLNLTENVKKVIIKIDFMSLSFHGQILMTNLIMSYFDLIMFKFNREIQGFNSFKAVEWIDFGKFIQYY